MLVGALCHKPLVELVGRNEQACRVKVVPGKQSIRRVGSSSTDVDPKAIGPVVLAAVTQERMSRAACQAT